MVKLANSADPDQRPLNVASDLGLQCLQIFNYFSLEISKSHSQTFLKLKLDSSDIL